MGTKEGSVYLKVTKVMYGLPQADRLANKLLKKRLNKQGYYQSKQMPGLWKHKKQPIQFTLVADDVGFKYKRKRNAQHLMKTLKEHYSIK